MDRTTLVSSCNPSSILIYRSKMYTYKLRSLDAEMEAILYTFITATAAIKYQTTHTTKTKTEPHYRNFLEETIINFMADWFPWIALTMEREIIPTRTDNYFRYGFSFLVYSASPNTTISGLKRCLIYCHRIMCTIASDQGTHLLHRGFSIWP